MVSQQETLAVDIGGPIINARGGSTPEQYLAAQPTDGCFEGLRALAGRFGQRIHLISQCNEVVQYVKLAWMARQDFNERTGVSKGRIHFVRLPHEKAEVCKKLGVTHFADDRPSILAFAKSVPHIYAFRVDPFELAQHPDVAARATLVQDWEALLGALLPGS